MKTPIAVIAIALACIVSAATADHHMLNDMNATDVNRTKRGKRSSSLVVPVGVISNDLDAKNNTVVVTNSNIVISLSDRVQLARIIKDILPNAAETDLASTMSIADLADLFKRISKTPGMFSNAAGIISAAKSGETGALAADIVDLLRATADPAAPTVTLTTAPLPALIVQAPMPMSKPPVALAAAATTST